MEVEEALDEGVQMRCKGCGLCAAECPCGAIEMEPEQT
jgi:Pyruvate/2-oxoacid:ferredoxin oxidoreductase delta subunit